MAFSKFIQSLIPNYAEHKRYFDAIADIELWNGKTVAGIYSKIEPELIREYDWNNEESKKINQAMVDFRAGKLKGTVCADYKREAYNRYLDRIVQVFIPEILRAIGENAKSLKVDIEKHREALAAFEPAIEILKKYPNNPEAKTALDPLEKLTESIRSFLADIDKPKGRKNKTHTGIDARYVISIIIEVVDLAQHCFAIEEGKPLKSNEAFSRKIQQRKGCSMDAILKRALMKLAKDCDITLKSSSIRGYIDNYPGASDIVSFIESGPQIPLNHIVWKSTDT